MLMKLNRGGLLPQLEDGGWSIETRFVIRSLEPWTNSLLRKGRGWRLNSIYRPMIKDQLCLCKEMLVKTLSMELSRASG